MAPHAKWQSDHPSVADWVRVIAAFPLFCGVGKRRLRELVRQATFAEFAPGETVIAKGDDADSLFVILGGTAKTRGTPTGRTLRMGDSFGELALLDGGQRSRTVVAATELHVMRVPRRAFFRLVERDAQVSLTMLEGLSAQFRRVETQAAAAGA